MNLASTTQARRVLVRSAVRAIALILLLIAMGGFAHALHIAYRISGWPPSLFGFLRYSQMLGSSLAYLIPGLVLLIGERWIVRWLVPPLRAECPQCGYLLTKMTSERCPECGLPLTGSKEPSTRTE